MRFPSFLLPAQKVLFGSEQCAKVLYWDVTMITIHFQMGNAGCFSKEPKDSLSFLCVCPLGRTMFSLLFISLVHWILVIYGLNMWFYLNQYIYIYYKHIDIYSLYSTHMTVIIFYQVKEAVPIQRSRSENPGSLEDAFLHRPTKITSVFFSRERIDESGKPDNTDLHVDTHRKIKTI